LDAAIPDLDSGRSVYNVACSLSEVLFPARPHTLAGTRLTTKL